MTNGYPGSCRHILKYSMKLNSFSTCEYKKECYIFSKPVAIGVQQKTIHKKNERTHKKNTCERIHFLITFLSASLLLNLKRDSGTIFILWVTQHFSEKLFCGTPMNGCFCLLSLSGLQKLLRFVRACFELHCTINEVVSNDFFSKCDQIRRAFKKFE